jgi:hypothetical protein
MEAIEAKKIQGGTKIAPGFFLPVMTEKKP